MLDDSDMRRRSDLGPSPEPSNRAGRRLRRIGTRTRRTLPFVGGVAATFLAIALYGIVNPGRPPITERDVRVAVASALASQVPAPPDSEIVYAAIRPSVVLIETDQKDGSAASRPNGAKSSR